MHELISHPTTLIPGVAFKNPSLKANGEFGSSGHLAARFLCWALAIDTVLSFTTTWSPLIVFAALQASRPKFGSVTGSVELINLEFQET